MMSMDMESAGALVNAGLVAHELEGHADRKLDGHGHGSNCANCQTALTGPYCHKCGQSAHVHRSLLHIGEELLHGILHLDGKVVRTLPMLVAFPGRLTRRYIDGQRMRYVSPLALFLFMIFLMFFTASYSNKHSLSGTPAEFKTATVKLEEKIEKSKSRLAKAEARLAAVAAKGGDASALSADVAKRRADLAEAQEALVAMQTVTIAAGKGDSDAAGQKKIGQTSTLSITTGFDHVDTAFKKAMENPELTIYKLKNTASKFSFLLVPISLPFLWLLFFWRRGVTMYDHAVFSLYSLSFMSLLAVVVMLLNMVNLDFLVGTLVLMAPPVHMFLQLKGCYELGTFGALWRTVALLFISLTVFMMYLVLIITLTVQ